MSTLTTINGNDQIKDSRAVINSNFDTLNTDKIETLGDLGVTKTAVQLNTTVDNAPTADEKAAMAGTGTPSDSNRFVTADSVLSLQLNCGETLNGATTPVPVYQNKTDNELYACDANDNTRYKFIGFVTSNGTNGNPASFQGQGVVNGFTGLAEGEKYYVQDTVGTIGTTPGTQEILVGVAVSETQLLIQKGTRRAIGGFSLTDNGGAGAVTTTTVTTGFRPSFISAYGVITGGNTSSATTMGFWNNGSYSSVFNINQTSSSVGLSTSYILIDAVEFSEQWKVTITSVTDTGFTFSATQRTTTPDTLSVAWSAQGEL